MEKVESIWNSFHVYLLSTSEREALLLRIHLTSFRVSMLNMSLTRVSCEFRQSWPRARWSDWQGSEIQSRSRKNASWDRSPQVQLQTLIPWIETRYINLNIAARVNRWTRQELYCALLVIYANKFEFLYFKIKKNKSYVIFTAVNDILYCLHVIHLTQVYTYTDNIWLWQVLWERYLQSRQKVALLDASNGDAQLVQIIEAHGAEKRSDAIYRGKCLLLGQRINRT